MRTQVKMAVMADNFQRLLFAVLVTLLALMFVLATTSCGDDSGNDDSKSTDGNNPGDDDDDDSTTVTGIEWNRPLQVGGDPSVVFDDQDKMHISYFDYSDKDLRYATNADGDWRIETPDAEGWAGVRTDIALLAGRPVISYRNEYSIKVAQSLESGWQIETVEIEPAGMFDGATSIATSMTGDLYVGYFLGGDNILKTATYDEVKSEWNTRVVDGNLVTGFDMSMVRDAAGRLQFAYGYITDEGTDLYLAVSDDDGFALEPAVTGGEIGWYVSLAVDTNGAAHISHYNSNENGLSYTTNSDGEWKSEIVDAGTEEIPEVGVETAIALDVQQRPRIAYVDGERGMLCLASKNDDDWMIEDIDEIGYDTTLPGGTALAYDSFGAPAVVYFDYNLASLKVAKQQTGSWIVEIVDGPELPE